MDEIMEEVAEQEDQPKDRRAALLEYLGEALPTEEVCGVIVRALDDEGYHRMKVLRQNAVSGAKPDDRVIMFNVGEDVALLTVGVIDPVMKFEEWMIHVSKAGRKKVAPIIEAIRRLSDIDPFEVEMVKSVLKNSA